MTAVPDPSDFAPKANVATNDAMMMQPNLGEHFWGYEGRLNEQVINIADLAWFARFVFSIGAFGAALGVWLVPAMTFAGGALATKATISAILLCFAALTLRFVVRGTRVRVQMDTANGELREVVDGLFGTDIELTSNGLDTVRLVRVVASKHNRSVGQIQITFADGTTLPFADGAVFALQDLRERIAFDCGLVGAGPSRTAIWAGPLAA